MANFYLSVQINLYKICNVVFEQCIIKNNELGPILYILPFILR
jgi:hypothetical protein